MKIHEKSQYDSKGHQQNCLKHRWRDNTDQPKANDNHWKTCEKILKINRKAIEMKGTSVKIKGRPTEKQWKSTKRQNENQSKDNKIDEKLIQSKVHQQKSMKDQWKDNQHRSKDNENQETIKMKSTPTKINWKSWNDNAINQNQKYINEKSIQIKGTPPKINETSMRRQWKSMICASRRLPHPPASCAPFLTAAAKRNENQSRSYRNLWLSFLDASPTRFHIQGRPHEASKQGKIS